MVSQSLPATGNRKLAKEFLAESAGSCGPVVRRYAFISLS